MPSDERHAPLPPAPDAIHVDGHERQDLSDAGWRVAACPADACATPADIGDLDWLPATVPGTAAGALRDAGRWDFGDDRDFDREDWWFQTEFETGAAASAELVLLRLDGVATVHEVFLNGERIGGGESMFAPAALDVGAALREGANELAIRCLALNGQLGTKRKPRARWRTKLADNRLRFFRTMLLGRCPGFAPGPAAVGPWRPVWIERRRGLAVSGIELRPRCEGDVGILAVRLRARLLDGAGASAADIVVTGADEAEAALAVTQLDGGDFELSGEVRLPSVRRWWPHTHGEPHLHDVFVRVATGDGEVGIDAGRVGFRELAAGPRPDHDVEEDGLDLHLNGVAVFARGAVWTPPDFVGMAPSEEELRAALEQVSDAGMNMVRIPGTSTYESPRFHDLCDELGILVWQDFAFANFDYPLADEDFRAAVATEVESVLAAVGGRPSLAVLCGNSEIEQQVAMLGLDPELGRGELFGELLPAAVERAAVDAVYLPSAPCGGALPFRPDRGVANYFGVGGYLRSLADARLAGVRFAAECLAFANIPDAAGIEAIAPGAVDLFVHEPRWKAGVPRDAGAGWDFDDVRDHYLELLFEVDPVRLRSHDPDRYLELSRAVSGEVMAAVFGEWRRAGSPCSGGLVLWLRDLMPGAGWGLVDHAGTPKAAWHHLRRALAPRAVWMTDEGLGGVGVHVANDASEPLAATLRIGLYRDGEQRVGESERSLELGPHEDASFDLEALLGRFADVSWAYRFGPPAQDLIVASLKRGGAEVGGHGEAETIGQAFYLPAGHTAEALAPKDLGIDARVEAGRGKDLSVQLTARLLVTGLRLEVDGYLPADDWISLEPGVERRVELRRQRAGVAGSTLTLRALNLRGRSVVALDAG
jgi:beta-mannosidase